MTTQARCSIVMPLVFIAIGCGGAPVESPEIQKSGLTFSYTEWIGWNTSYAQCPGGYAMIGAAIDDFPYNTILVECADLGNSFPWGSYTYTALPGAVTLLGVTPACTAATDVMIGWGPSGNGEVNITCRSTNYYGSEGFHDHYVDGPSGEVWGNGAFTYQGRTIYSGQWCAKAGYVMRAFGELGDNAVCGH
jgi:hypothetical protein